MPSTAAAGEIPCPPSDQEGSAKQSAKLWTVWRVGNPIKGFPDALAGQLVLWAHCYAEGLYPGCVRRLAACWQGFRGVDKKGVSALASRGTAYMPASSAGGAPGTRGTTAWFCPSRSPFPARGYPLDPRLALRRGDGRQCALQTAPRRATGWS